MQIRNQDTRYKIVPEIALKTAVVVMLFVSLIFASGRNMDTTETNIDMPDNQDKNTISIYSEDLTKNVTYRGAEVMGYG